MSSDLTFITNENDRNLAERFRVLLGGNTRAFDCLVGYFYLSGFRRLAVADRDLADDPDGDGIDNGVENFFGTHPGTFSQGLAAGIRSGNAFNFTHPQGTLAADLSASYRWSADLAAFHLGGQTSSGTTVNFTTEADTPSPGFTRVTATATGTLPDRLFVDVEVTGP